MRAISDTHASALPLDERNLGYGGVFSPMQSSASTIARLTFSSSVWQGYPLISRGLSCALTALRASSILRSMDRSASSLCSLSAAGLRSQRMT